MSTSQAVVPALGSIWLQQLAQRCAQEGVPLPGGDGLHQKLANKQAPPPQLRGKLAQAIHNEWVKGRTEVPPWQLQALVDAIEAWWHLLPAEAHPLAAGMAPAWV